MSFAKNLANVPAMDDLSIELKRCTPLAGSQIVAATPVGVAVGSALVAAGLAGAQVGDLAD